MPKRYPGKETAASRKRQAARAEREAEALALARKRRRAALKGWRTRRAKAAEAARPAKPAKTPKPAKLAKSAKTPKPAKPAKTPKPPAPPAPPPPKRRRPKIWSAERLAAEIARLGAKFKELEKAKAAANRLQQKIEDARALILTAPPSPPPALPPPPPPPLPPPPPPKHFAEGELGRIRDEAFEKIRDRFGEILEELRQDGKYPTPGEAFGEDFKMGSIRNVGLRRHIAFDDLEVTEESIPDIVGRIDEESAALDSRAEVSGHAFDFWLCNLVVVSYGRKAIGYNIGFLGGPDPITSGIQNDGVICTGRITTGRLAMVKRIGPNLAEWLDERSIIVLVHASIFYYSEKAPE